MSERQSTVRRLIEEAEAVVVGAGSGMSASAGLTYTGRRFLRNSSDFIERYGMTDMYSAGFYLFPQEEKWAYWSRHIYCNRYDVPAGKPYLDLYQLVKDRELLYPDNERGPSVSAGGFPGRTDLCNSGRLRYVSVCKGLL